MNPKDPISVVYQSIQLLSMHQAFFTPVFAFAYFCLALYKHWKKFFPFPTTIITNTAIHRRHFYVIELQRFDRKTFTIHVQYSLQWTRRDLIPACNRGSIARALKVIINPQWKTVFSERYWHNNILSSKEKLGQGPQYGTRNSNSA